MRTIGFFSRFLKMMDSIIRYRKILKAITVVEFAKRYSGSVLGKLWILLYPIFLLSIYIFVYMVIFKMRFPGFSEFDYVLFVFAGLIPFLGLSESLSAGTVSIKQNIHLVKNVMLPIELVPVKIVLVSMVSQVVSMAILVVLAGANGSLGVNIVILPFVFVLQLMFLIGLVWILSAIAVPLPDVSYFVNLFILLLMFVSPIGFKPEMVPEAFKLSLYLNPIYYMTEMYRHCIIYSSLPSLKLAMAYTALCVGTFVIGGAFFHKFKNVLVDYE